MATGRAVATAKRSDPDSGNAYGNVSSHLPTSTPAGSCRFFHMPPVPLDGSVPSGMGISPQFPKSLSPGRMTGMQLKNIRPLCSGFKRALDVGGALCILI
ncbi:MAG: hypothetical protein RL630_1274, partial [Verrucomicrobiota bacterium]